MKRDTNSAKSQDITDLLLYLGAAIVAGIGISWLVMARPWSDFNGAGVSPESEPEARGTPTREPMPLAHPEAAPENSLRIARLAYEAGMLVEPDRYSAWSLYSDILAEDPGNPAAEAGLEQVADALIARAATAFEQGRLDDAESAVQRVLAALPMHDEAMQLSIAITEQQRAGAASVRTRPPTDEEAPRLETPVTAADSDAANRPLRVVETPAALQIDPIRDLRASFDEAVAADALVRPASESAEHFLSLMSEIDPQHSQTIEAREILFDTFLRRAAIATIALDEAAAETWIDKAERLRFDPRRIEEARAVLLENLVMAESAKPLPAAQLTILEYTPPRYPTAAANRQLEGWVDIEFVVETDGSTADVVVAEASHEEYFGEEAVTAVEAWRFEPRIFHNRPIEQKAYTRIRFVLE